MKESDIKAGHMYYVDFEPVRGGEFNGIHLSVVLKKNNDKRTCVVMPLTSSANGDGVNKVNIGKITELPPKLNAKDTYAVYNQVRTVNVNRLRAIKGVGKRVSIPLKNSLLLKLLDLAVCDLLYSIKQDDRISVLKSAYDKERFNKAKDLAYNIIKIQKADGDDEKISVIKAEIREILKDAAYTLDATQTADGIQKIFDEALKHVEI